MTNELTDLARRAVACKGWRWMPGMLWCEQTSLGLSKQRLLDYEIDGFPAYYGCLPDLSDPATLGCLLTLVREAWKSPVAQVYPSLPDGHIWTCYINDEADDRLFRERTEAEALVAALEAAPVAGGVR